MGRIRSTSRLLRALWRYRGDIAAQADVWQVEFATIARSELEAGALRRSVVGALRWVLRAVLVLALTLLAIAVVAAAFAARSSWLFALLIVLVALVPTVPMLLWWWRVGAPLRWIDEHADPSRVVPLAEARERIEHLLAGMRATSDVRGRITHHLAELAAASQPAAASGRDASAGPHLPGSG